MDFLYRYEEMKYAPSPDAFGEIRGEGSVGVNLRQYPIAKRTPKGEWIYDYAGMKRFVLRDAHKRYACPTKEEAFVSFIKRKERHLRILRSQIKTIEIAMAVAKKMKEKDLPHMTGSSIDLCFG